MKTLNNLKITGCTYQRDFTPIEAIPECPHTITAEEFKELMIASKDAYPLSIWFKGRLPELSQKVKAKYAVDCDERYRDGTGYYSITYKGG